MINSRKVEDLHPRVAKMCRDFIEACRKQGIDIIITSTYRDNESQNALYAQGRTKSGNRVTNAKGGQSFHNYKLAFDFLPGRNGKYDWTDLVVFKQCGEIGKSIGLEWAGDWKTFKEYAHLQFTDGLTLHDLQAGKQINP
jgi:peptidoglycan L-alanyl-D-glutamate endopeptidase CwlK